MLSTSNPISLLRSFILFTTIQILAFKINLDYFSSDKYKKIIDDRLKELDDDRIIDDYRVKVLKKFNELYVDALKIEVNKLEEILGNDKDKVDVNNKVFKLLKDMNMDFILDDKRVFVKKRTKIT